MYATRSQHILMEVGAGNGIEVYVNGKSIMKHLNPYRCTFRTEKLIVPLQKGDNQIVLRAYNRFEGRTGYLLRPAKEQVVYRQDFTLPDATDGKRHTITVRPHHPSSAPRRRTVKLAYFPPAPGSPVSSSNLFTHIGISLPYNTFFLIYINKTG